MSYRTRHHPITYAFIDNQNLNLGVLNDVKWYVKEDGKLEVKGNVDTDIVLYSVGELADEFDKAVFVSGDGDFLSLYDYMDKRQKLAKIIVPNRFKYSKLLQKYRRKLAFVADVPELFGEPKKTRSSGRRQSSLGQPGHGDKKIIAKPISKVKNGAKK
jgi:hypothetical protein